MTRYRLILSIIFVTFWIAMAIQPAFRSSWLLENYPIFIWVPIVILVGRKVGFSSASYTMIALFMMLHMVGAHYTYEKVPGGFWLGELFSSDRNMYDRFVHMSFGLLITYPAFEVFMKAAKLRNVWNYLFTFSFVMMLAGGYEVIEWITSVNSNPNASMAYLGAQGDIWDTQIDIYVAGLGCLFTLVVIFLMRWRVTSRVVSSK